MPNLNFVLMGLNDWDVVSVYTNANVGAIQFNQNWNMYAFSPAGPQLDSSALREIAKFLDEQDQLRGQR